MSNYKNKIYKARLNLLKITNQIKYYIIDGPTVNVVSCNEYKNKRKEDLILQKYLLKAGYKAKISSWEDNEKANVNIIRSVWGYHKKVDDFLNFVNSNNTINNKLIISENVDKKKQFGLLKANDIEIIDTQFINHILALNYKGQKIVVKPTISASGHNTYIIENEKDIEQVLHLNNIMVQPYIPSINEGEISVIAINRIVKYAIKRYPGVFTEYKKEEYISKINLDKDLVEIVKKILLIEEYKKAVIMRIDFVHTEQGYKVMEVELVDPDLFIETIPDENLKKEVYEDLVHAVDKYLNRTEE